MKNIVDTAVSAGGFKTLVKAIKAAGLVETLSGKGPYTVFAPNDVAFSRVPGSVLEKIMRDKEDLTSVLKFHVVKGNYMARNVKNMGEMESLEGSDLRINTRDGIKVSGASLIHTDIKCSNGVIHVIDKVLIPSEVMAKVAIPA